LTTLRQSVGIWKKLGKARGALYRALEGLDGFSGLKVEEARREIRRVLEATACDPPDDLDINEYVKGRVRKRQILLVGLLR